MAISDIPAQRIPSSGTFQSTSVPFGNCSFSKKSLLHAVGGPKGALEGPKKGQNGSKRCPNVVQTMFTILTHIGHFCSLLSPFEAL